MSAIEPVTLPGYLPLVVTTRGAGVENVHYGAVAVVDAQGRLLHAVGDAAALVFTRSTLKPFQALPMLLDGVVEHFGFDARALALLCASHSGEARHLEVVRTMLDQAGCNVGQLQCGDQVPLSYAARGQVAPSGTWTALHNNCSGKHAGFLAWCRLHAAPLATYLDEGHPLQQRIRMVVAQAAQLDATALVAGTDGCSAPNYAMPLSSLAALYARLATSEVSNASDVFASALGRLFAAMTCYPELVSGDARNDLDFMRTAPGDWVAKVGADGVQAIGIRSRGLGIAIKIADGDRRALCTAAVEVLRQLSLVSEPAATPLAAWAQPRIVNLRGLQTGSVRACFKLRGLT